MGYGGAIQAVQRLNSIAAISPTMSLNTWLALVEDELQRIVPDSHLLSRFAELKTQTDSEKSDAHTKSMYLELVSAASIYVSYLPLSNADLTSEVERIIQKGYFQSIWFRAVLGGLALVLMLVTGVEGYRLNEQVKAMERQVEQARKQVEDGRLEVAKASTANSESQAKLALLILQNNQDIVKMQTEAIAGMAAEEASFKTRVETETARWTDQITKKDGPEASDRVTKAGTDGAANIGKLAAQANDQMYAEMSKGKVALSQHLSSSITSLDATKNPWVPRAIWSIAKTWLIVPFSLFIALLGWTNTFTRRVSNTGTAKWGNVLSAINVIVLIAAIAFVLTLK